MPVGQQYSVPRSSKEATTASDGIKCIKEEKYFDEKLQREGTFTEKVYYLHRWDSIPPATCDRLILGSYVPGYLRAVLPSSALRLEERVSRF